MTKSARNLLTSGDKIPTCCDIPGSCDWIWKCRRDRVESGPPSRSRTFFETCVFWRPACVSCKFLAFPTTPWLHVDLRLVRYPLLFGKASLLTGIRSSDRKKGFSALAPFRRREPHFVRSFLFKVKFCQDVHLDVLLDVCIDEKNQTVVDSVDDRCFKVDVFVKRDVVEERLLGRNRERSDGFASLSAGVEIFVGLTMSQPMVTSRNPEFTSTSPLSVLVPLVITVSFLKPSKRPKFPRWISYLSECMRHVLLCWFFVRLMSSDLSRSEIMPNETEAQFEIRQPRPRWLRNCLCGRSWISSRSRRCWSRSSNPFSSRQSCRRGKGRLFRLPTTLWFFPFIFEINEGLYHRAKQKILWR